MRRLIAVIVSGVVALGVAACGNEDDSGGAGSNGSSDQPAAQEARNEPITLAVGVDTVYAPMFLADAEGLFEKQGLDVTIQQFAQGGEGVDAMVAGSVQVAGSGDSTVLGKTRGNIRSLGVFVEDEGNYVKLVTRTAIDDPEQIKKMGIVPGSISEFGAARLLDAEGIDPSTVEFVPAGPPELPALLKRGDVDGFVIWEPWPTKAKELGGKVLAPSKAFGFSYVLMINATEEWLSGHEEQARKVMAALDEATKRAESDPQAAAEATMQAAKIPIDQSLQAVRELEFGVRGFTEQDTKNFNQIAEFLLERDLVKERPDPQQLVAKGYVPGQ